MDTIYWLLRLSSNISFSLDLTSVVYESKAFLNFKVIRALSGKKEKRKKEKKKLSKKDDPMGLSFFESIVYLKKSVAHCEFELIWKLGELSLIISKTMRV
jgi:hypothetical protein